MHWHLLQEQNDLWYAQCIADLISRIESVQNTDSILDKLENRKFGDTGFFGTIFGKDD
jgi:hypothetical protein